MKGRWGQSILWKEHLKLFSTLVHIWVQGTDPSEVTNFLTADHISSTCQQLQYLNLLMCITSPKAPGKRGDNNFELIHESPQNEASSSVCESWVNSLDGRIYRKKTEWVRRAVVKNLKHMGWAGNPAPSNPKLMLKLKGSFSVEKCTALGGNIKTDCSNVGTAAPPGWAAFGCLKKHIRQLWTIPYSLLGASQSRSWDGSKRTAKEEKGLCLNESLHAMWGLMYVQMQSRSSDVPNGDAAHYSHQGRSKIAVPSHSSFLPLLFLSLQWNYVEKEFWFSPVLATD